MATVLAKILDGEVGLDGLGVTFKSDGNKGVPKERENLTQPNLSELAPFLLNFLREQTSHHFSSRQNAAHPPKKAAISQTKGKKIAVEQPHQGLKNSSRGNVFPPKKTPSPSPVTPLSQSRRDKLQVQNSSSSLSPCSRRRSPKFVGNDQDSLSPLNFVEQQNIDINNPDDFPPMSSISKKSTPSRRITPTQVKSDGKKGKTSPAFTSAGISFSQPSLENYGSPASLQEERNLLKLMKSKRKSKGDSPSENRHMGGVRSPTQCVLGDYIKTPPKQTSLSKDDRVTPPKCATMSTAWEPNIDTRKRVPSTPSLVKDIIGNTSSPNAMATEDLKCQKGEKQIQTVLADQLKVHSQDKLDVLAKIYSECITGNFVPNVTAELYFVVQILTVCGVSSDAKENEETTSNGTENNNGKNNLNIFYSLHNCTYFAVKVLQDLQRLILLLDKDTLRLFAENPRIAEFSPTLKETFLEGFRSLSPVKVPDVNCIKSPLGGVPFSVERDNKQNFPSDRAFYNFRKQRDIFYELVREWEDCNSATGWNMEDHMGDRIRALVNQKPELANYSHFARLFKSQLLQMCEEERNGSSFRNSSMLTNLQKSNPEKFQRLQERFVTPSSSAGICPSPSFTNVQEFFKGFITSAASHSFNQHLIDLLIVTIAEINDKEFPLADMEEDSERDRSIQNQELKLEFSNCLTKIRILAKFLGFLLFQPYYGVETTSQTVVKETLKIRNRAPIQFDVLSHLKKACFQGRLVLTVPWAVEYLSMMDHVAPLLDYFSETLHWLSRTYRSLASAPKPELNHSKLLLISCIGWLFEISVIPASFFFKSLSEQNSSIDYEIKLSDARANLDCGGVVDQAILYSCCPYLGEIRSVLVEAAAGQSGRTGPVKKITPVSADEPSRISSTQKQLQLQLEENFFRIQPDFVKRLSDFTVERLCSNVISHIKGTIIPSVLDKGSQRIREFLEVEFFGNTKIDQAKEKCRPCVLKIIHAVTDDGVKIATESIERSKSKSLSAFENLCPEDMNPKVISTAANITTRLVKEKLEDWINSSFPNIVEEQLFAQFNKIANSILTSKSKEEQISIESISLEEQSDGKDEPKAEHSSLFRIAAETIQPIKAIKVLQEALSHQSKLLVQQSSDEDTSLVVEAITIVQSLLDKGQFSVKETTLIGQISVELAYILVCRSSYGALLLSTEKDCKILENLSVLWSCLKAAQVPAPLSKLLSASHSHLIMTIEGRQVVWRSLETLFVVLLRKKLIGILEVGEYYVDALEKARDEEAAVEIGQACFSLIQAYHHNTRKLLGDEDKVQKTLHLPEFPLLLSSLYQRFAENLVLAPVIEDFIKDVDGVIAVAKDPDG
ncbi:codanin-1-like isoform X1 [Acropora millepora]|uniref:codanin-1-like isoform X1 n=1 Tax=Acropora millepora TaxID=45264 RepID=UPI001CF25488|nr:codanin-1-like isoform X1 [Acropora millepora]